jgi:hypothetical protein
VYENSTDFSEKGHNLLFMANSSYAKISSFNHHIPAMRCKYFVTKCMRITHVWYFSVELVLGIVFSYNYLVIGPPSSSRRESHTEVTLKLWKEGFSINDGAVREYADPANREFLESVRRG